MPVGTLVLPDPSNVLLGVQYGADGTEYTGTLYAPSGGGGSSTAVDIANGLVSIIASLSGAPSKVVWRKTEVWHPTGADGTEGICVSGGLDTTMDHVMDGSEYHEYAFQIAYFKPVLPTGIQGDDINPSLFKAITSALSITTFPGVPVVWDYEIAARQEWEDQEFSAGVEVSRCGVLYRTNEAT